MSSARAEQRATRARAAWEAETTAPIPEVRQRGRHIESNTRDAATLDQHNAWDDVEWLPEEVAAAEALVASQPLAPSAAGDACRAKAAACWDYHYVNLRGYKDRRYLLNEFPGLLPPGRSSVHVLETGCGVGNTLLPLLATSPRIAVVGCDISATAVSRANERLAREGLAHRGRAVVWDVARPAVAGALPRAGVDVVLSIFTLSALPPDDLPAAFSELAASLKPGGRLFFRDYGRLDLKQMKFAAAARGRLGGASFGAAAGGASFGAAAGEGRLGGASFGAAAGEGTAGGVSSTECEWYARGDGTTCVFFTVEAVESLARSAGLEVESVRCASGPDAESFTFCRPSSLLCSCRYDQRLVVNRAEQKRMLRVWVVASLRRPGGPPPPLSLWHDWRRWWRCWPSPVAAGAAALLVGLAVLGRRRVGVLSLSALASGAARFPFPVWRALKSGP